MKFNKIILENCIIITLQAYEAYNRHVKGIAFVSYMCKGFLHESPDLEKNYCT